MSTSCSCVRSAHHGMHCEGGRRPTWVHKASMVLRAVTSVSCAMAVCFIGLSGNCTNNSPHPPRSITPCHTPHPSLYHTMSHPTSLALLYHPAPHFEFTSHYHTTPHTTPHHPTPLTPSPIHTKTKGHPCPLSFGGVCCLDLV